jgi:hypothetical protein
MAKRVAGICYIKVDGEQLEVSGGVEVPIVDVKRETVMGLAGPAGLKETALEPFVKVSAIFMPSFPLDTIRTNTEMTITAEMANGKVYTLSGAFLKGEPSVKGEDGTVELEFGGKKGQWQ